MKKLSCSLVVFICIFCYNTLSAQTYSTGREIKKAVVNFSELAKDELAHPWPKHKKPPFEEDEENDGPPSVRPEPGASEVFMLNRAISTDASEHPHGRAYLPVSPAPNDSFQSTVTDGTAIPPDTHGAVDSNYCVTAINTDIHIQTRTGTNVSSVTLDHFWNSVLPYGSTGTDGGSFDPRVHYDPLIHRWIMVADAYGETSVSQIMVAISATGNPTGTWYLYAVVTDATGATWLDFPNVGYNQKWLTVTGNYFSNSTGSATGAVAFVFDITSLAAGSSATYTKVSEGSSFSLAPALTYDSSETSMFMIEDYSGSSGKLRLWKITGTATSVSIASVGYPATSTHWATQGPGGGADFGPQVGTSNKLQTNDDRTNNFVQRNHHLWCAYTAFFPATRTPTRSSAMWWEIDTTGSPMQVGLIDDPSNNNFYAFPSIAVNASDDALIGMACFSASIHPSAGFALHKHTDPADSVRPAFIYRHGQATYYETFGGTQCRWGDYSGTCVDPKNDNDFWTIQESVPPTSAGSNYWDTWWAYIQMCPTPVSPTPSITPAVQCIGTTALYSIEPVSGATGYTWTVSGTGWSGSSTTDSIYLTAGTGIATVTVTASNSCGPGSAYIYNITPGTVPPTPVINTVTTACVGSSSAAYSATCATATSYSWSVSGSGWSGSGSTDTLAVTVGTGVGTIICTSINSCGTGASDTVNITPATVPSADSGITGSSPLCAGSAATFTTAAVTGATSYTWAMSGAGWSGSSTSTSITATVGTSVGSMTVTPVNACGNGTPFVLNSIMPIIPPTANFTVTTHTTSTHINDVITYTGTGTSTDTYTWNFGGGVASPGTGAGPQTVYWTTGGVKSISLTVTDSGCSSTVYIDAVTVNNVGVPEVNMEALNISVRPNPNNGNFDVVFAKNVSKNINVKLIDMQGRTVYEKQFNGTNNKQVSIETAELPAGNYAASVSIDGEVSVNMITIAR